MKSVRRGKNTHSFCLLGDRLFCAVNDEAKGDLPEERGDFSLEKRGHPEPRFITRSMISQNDALIISQIYKQLAIPAKGTGHDPNYLGLLARQGKLEAMKCGGRWYLTLAAIQIYQDQAQEGLKQRGRPPKVQR